MSSEYWLQWQVAVCGVIFIIPSVLAAIFIKKASNKDPFLGPTDLWIPSWKNLHPSWLLCYRALALATLCFLLHQALTNLGFFEFYFYTQWTFVLVILYFILGTIISARGCWLGYGKPMSPNEERDRFIKRSEENHEASTTSIERGSEKQSFHSGDTYEQSIRFMDAFMEVVYQICAGAAVLTDIVFWCILVPFTMKGNFKVTLLIGFMHSVNVIFLLVDSAFNCRPVSWYGLTYFILWSCTYIVFQWILHACCISWWPYPFLELSSPSAPLWYLALTLIHIPCYGLYMLLVQAKNSLFSRVFPNVFGRWY